MDPNFYHPCRPDWARGEEGEATAPEAYRIRALGMRGRGLMKMMDQDRRPLHSSRAPTFSPAG